MEAAFGVEKLGNFRGCPCPVGAFVFFGIAFLAEGVGVLGGVEAAVFIEHFREEVGEYVFGGLAEEVVLGDLPCLDVGEGELGLVVEHFFVMRDVPVAIDGIAVEAAAEVIVDAAPGDGAEGIGGHVAGHFRFVGAFGEALVKLHEGEHECGTGKFRGVAEAALLGIEHAVAGVEVVAEDFFRREAAECLGLIGLFAELRHDVFCALEDLRFVIAVSFAELLADVRKTGAAVFVFGWKIGAADDG